jgi:hypothetical protein
MISPALKVFIEANSNKRKLFAKYTSKRKKERRQYYVEYFDAKVQPVLFRILLSLWRCHVVLKWVNFRVHLM